MQLRAIECDDCDWTNADIFGRIGGEQRRVLGHARNRRRYRAGHRIQDEGEHCGIVHCIHSGRAKLFKVGPDDKEVIVGLVGPREIVGHLSCIDGGPHSCSVETLSEVVACAIPGERFLRILLGNSESSLPLLRKLAGDLRSIQNEVVCRTHMKASCRIARLLVWFVERDQPRPRAAELRIPLKQLEIAQMTGTTPETVSRVLHTLQRKEVVEHDGQDFRVRDLDQLRAMADGRNVASD